MEWHASTDLEVFKTIAKLNRLEAEQSIIAIENPNALFTESVLPAREGFGGRILHHVTPSACAWSESDFEDYRKTLQGVHDKGLLAFIEALKNAGHADADIVHNQKLYSGHESSRTPPQLCQRFIKHMLVKLENPEFPGYSQTPTKYDAPNGYVNTVVVRQCAAGRSIDASFFREIINEKSLLPNERLLIDGDRRMVYRNFDQEKRVADIESDNAKTISESSESNAALDHERKLDAHAIDFFFTELAKKYGYDDAQTALHEASLHLSQPRLQLTQQLIKRTLVRLDDQVRQRSSAESRRGAASCCAIQ